MNSKSFHRLLLPTDFSDLSLSALDYVQSFNTFQKSTIYLMHVVENVPMLAFPVVELDSEIIMRNAEEDAKADIDKIINDRIRTLDNIIPVIRRGVPSKEITQFAKTANIDLIVIATHGRTGIVHAIMGSVAEEVVRFSSVPVLTVKPPELQEHRLHENDLDGQIQTIG